MNEQQELVVKEEQIPSAKSFKKVFIGIGIIGVIILGIAIYYDHARKYPSTDDAYVNANLINVAPKVGGFIKNIHVVKNQLVQKGDLLFGLDPVDYDFSADQSAQNVAYAKQQVEIFKQNITIAETNVAKAQSAYDFSDKMAKRYTELFKQQAGTEQDMQKYINDATQAQQQLDQAKLSLQQANAQYKGTIAQFNVNKVALNSAKTQTSYTQVRAGVTGFVTDLNLANGQLVQAGQNVFGLVDDKSWWIDANFKETQLDRIKVGQSVKAKLDMYDHVYDGVVESISRASGNTFSILPAQNATGNWVKVTQRFAVVIKIKDDPQFPLRVGASVNITVDTTK